MPGQFQQGASDGHPRGIGRRSVQRLRQFGVAEPELHPADDGLTLLRIELRKRCVVRLDRLLAQEGFERRWPGIFPCRTERIRGGVARSAPDFVPDPVHHGLPQVCLETRIGSVLEHIDLPQSADDRLLYEVVCIEEAPRPPGQPAARPAFQRRNGPGEHFIQRCLVAGTGLGKESDRRSFARDSGPDGAIALPRAAGLVRHALHFMRGPEKVTPKSSRRGTVRFRTGRCYLSQTDGFKVRPVRHAGIQEARMRPRGTALIAVLLAVGLTGTEMSAQKGKKPSPGIAGGPSDAVFADLEGVDGIRMDRIRSDGYLTSACASGLPGEESRYCGGTYTDAETGLTYGGVGPECSRISYGSNGDYAFRTISSKCETYPPLPPPDLQRRLVLDFSEHLTGVCRNDDAADDVIERTVNGESKSLNV